MKQWMKATQLGLPRYVWAILLAGGLGVGLYIRARSGGEPDPDEGYDPGYTDTMAYSGQMEGGLVGAGVIGPAPGALTPVQTPFLPEGVTDVISDLSLVTSNLADTVADIAIERGNGGVDITGGGPPVVPADAHTPAGTGCTPQERARLAALAARQKAINARLRVIASQIEKARKRPNFARNENLKRNVTRLQNERTRLQRERTTVVNNRQRLQRKCRA